MSNGARAVAVLGVDIWGVASLTAAEEPRGGPSTQSKVSLDFPFELVVFPNSWWRLGGYGEVRVRGRFFSPYARVASLLAERYVLLRVFREEGEQVL